MNIIIFIMSVHITDKTLRDSIIEHACDHLPAEVGTPVIVCKLSLQHALLLSQVRAELNTIRMIAAELQFTETSGILIVKRTYIPCAYSGSPPD